MSSERSGHRHDQLSCFDRCWRRMGNLRWMIFLGAICIITVFFSVTFDLQLRSGAFVTTSNVAIHPRLLEDLGHMQFWLVYTDKNGLVHQVQIAASLDSVVSDLRGRIFDERIFRLPTGTFQTDISFRVSHANGTETLLEPTALVGQSIVPHSNVSVHIEVPVPPKQPGQAASTPLPLSIFSPPPPPLPYSPPPPVFNPPAEVPEPSATPPSPPADVLKTDADGDGAGDGADGADPDDPNDPDANPVPSPPAGPANPTEPAIPADPADPVPPVAPAPPAGPDGGIVSPPPASPVDPDGDGDPLAGQTPDPAEVSIDQVVAETTMNSTMCSWQKLEGKFKGKRVFIVGNAPTINLLPLHMLKEEYTMVFNRWYLMEERLTWQPSFFLVIDSRVAKDTAKEIDSYVPKLRENAFIPDTYGFFAPNDKICRFKLHRMGFRSPPDVGGGGTVAHAGLQILHYMGFSPIYTLGIDLAYVLPNTTEVDRKDPTDWTSKANIDPNHFDPRYFGTNYQYHYPQVEETMKPALRNASKYIKEHGGELYDAGLGNVLVTLGIEQVDMNNLFNATEPHEQLRAMVRAAIEKCDHHLRVKRITRRSSLLKSLVNADPCVAGTNSTKFFECVQRNSTVIVANVHQRSVEDLNEAVYNYKVFGPHDKQLLLCLRKVPISKH
eukprot:TRINITY_DN9947_c0_g1_i1.p1 TRINITY_DN9947_c0_g1~~TRINITY_DN9947_c0_g1_i1.p1  ORF type:complete len:667 (-),score=224.77 TRINITY_DN9947_c0_g1_i1:599-2599(-)